MCTECVQYAKPLACFLISDLVIANLFMHSLLGFYFTWPYFFTLKAFLHEILNTYVVYDLNGLDVYTLCTVHE